jgi:PKHD-type hydroxylase
MILHIKRLLTAAQLADFTQLLATAEWGDGRATAGPGSARVKANEQVSESCPVGRDLGRIILAELERNPLFLSAALPRHVYPPLFNRYGAGMSFRLHIDNAMRQVPGTPYRIRTDISATIFLSDPANYDGGELVIEDGDAQPKIKLPAGDMVLYSGDTRHQVTEVTKGVRVAAFFWVQSLVRDTAARSILFDLDSATRELSAVAPDCPAVLRLTSAYHSLIRRWAEP